MLNMRIPVGAFIKRPQHGSPPCGARDSVTEDGGFRNGCMFFNPQSAKLTAPFKRSPKEPIRRQRSCHSEPVEESHVKTL